MSNSLKEWIEENKAIIRVADSVDYERRMYNDDVVNKACYKIFNFLNTKREPEKDEIVVFCDYDVDGVASGKVAYESLLLAGAEPSKVHVFPDDRTHGFGLQPAYVDLVLERYPNVGLVITTDNGTASGLAPQMFANHGVDIIITDHHPEDEYMHDRLGKFSENLVNVNSLDSKYAFKGLSGTGVVWKMFQTYFYIVCINKLMDKSVLKKFNKLIPYVALSVISDSMPVIEENRKLLETGLEQINNEDIDTFWTVMKNQVVNKYSPIVDEETFGWSIAPMINAVSRIYLQPELALYALGVFRNESKGEEMFKKISELPVNKNMKANSLSDKIQMAVNGMVAVNDLRKKIVDEIMGSLDREQELTIIQSEMLSEETKQSYVEFTGRDRIVLSSIAGIIAARISQDKDIPSIVVAQEYNAQLEEVFNGSARSNQMNITNVDESISGISGVHVHGHAHAAGVRFDSGVDIDMVAQQIMDYIQTQPVISNEEMNSYLNPADVTFALLEEVQNMKPFGMNLEEPQFKFNIDFNDKFQYRTKVMFNQKSHKEHLKIVDLTTKVEIMVWNINHNNEIAPFLDDLRNGMACPLQVTFTAPIRIDEYRGKRSFSVKINHYDLKTK